MRRKSIPGRLASLLGSAFASSQQHCLEWFQELAYATFLAVLPLEQFNGSKRTNEYKALPPELIVSSSLEETIRDYFLEIGITRAVDAIDVRAHVSGVAEKAEFVPLQWILGSDNDLAYFHACTG